MVGLEEKRSQVEQRSVSSTLLFFLSETKYCLLRSVHDFTSHLVKAWDTTFYRQFPQEKITYVDGAKALITAFAAAVIDKDICPDVSDPIDVLKERIIRADKLLRTQTDTAFDDMKKVVKKSHKEAVPAVKEFLEEMYVHCAAEGGKLDLYLLVEERQY